MMSFYNSNSGETLFLDSGATSMAWTENSSRAKFRGRSIWDDVFSEEWLYHESPLDGIQSRVNRSLSQTPTNLAVGPSFQPIHTSLWKDNMDVDDTYDLDETVLPSLSTYNNREDTALASPKPLNICKTQDTIMSESTAMVGPTILPNHPIGTEQPSGLPRNKPRIYSDEEWEDQREMFEKLYIREDKPLKLVAKIMRDELGFHATVKQYKTRISQWRLEKNIKRHEMMAIVRKQYQRKAVDNKNSAFRVRGREVEATKIDRFIKRQATNNTEALSITSPAASIVSAISCYTPRNGGPASLPMSPPLLEEEVTGSMSGILTSTLPSDETSSQPFTTTSVEPTDYLYQYFPPALGDWMPPMDAI